MAGGRKRKPGVQFKVNLKQRTSLIKKSKGEKQMSLISAVVVLIVIGVILMLVNTYIPMDRKIKSILNGVVLIVVVLWLLQSFGILDDIKGIRLR